MPYRKEEAINPMMVGRSSRAQVLEPAVFMVSGQKAGEEPDWVVMRSAEIELGKVCDLG